MIQNNKVIEENKFMSREKVLIFQIVSTLKRLGEEEDFVQKLIEKSKGPKEEMLAGVAEQLTVIRDKYSKDSYGYTAIQEIISDINGGKNEC